MARKRMHRGLVALSASAVAAVYMAGYLRTQPADAAIDPPTITTPVAAVAAAPPMATATSLPQVVRTPVPTATPGISSATTTTASTYKDGTYTGTGSSRRGDVWVSVDVQSGRIANVTITRSTLQYPLRDIANLPAEVVTRQSAQVDIISRATYSSQAFRTAVAQALAKAA